YPHRVAGETIPLVGRIVAVADVFDAVTSKRVYKEAADVETAVGIIRNGRGTQFDPAVVDAFLTALPALLAARAASPDTALRVAAIACVKETVSQSLQSTGLSRTIFVAPTRSDAIIYVSRAAHGHVDALDQAREDAANL